MGFIKKLFGLFDKECDGASESDVKIKSPKLPPARKPTKSDIAEGKVWYLLPKGSSKRGLFTAEGLKNQLGKYNDKSGLSVRKFSNSKWCPWSQAGAIYPELLEAAMVPQPTEGASKPEVSDASEQKLSLSARNGKNNTSQTNEWYFAEDKKIGLRQIVLSLNGSSPVKSQFGSLILRPHKYGPLHNDLAVGFFKLDSDPGPFLLIKNSKFAKKMATESITLAFTFCYMPSVHNLGSIWGQSLIIIIKLDTIVAHKWEEIC